jgi:hypothetical protein
MMPGFSPAVGRGAACQIEKETLKKRISNNESSSGGQVSKQGMLSF